MGRPRPGLSTGSVNEAVVSGKHCIDWYPAQRRSSDGEIRKQIPTSSGTNPERPSPHDIRMSQWPWARLERRAVCAERCPYGSGRRSAYALLTPLWTQEGWLYLAVVIDLFSRQVVGFAMSERMTRQLVIDALRMAWFRRRPTNGLIFHSDRGSQYASGDFQKQLVTFGMKGSMSRKGDCWDNAVTETLFGSLKVERLHGMHFATRRQAKDEVIDWLQFYNHRRLHSTLGYLSPMAFEKKRLADKERLAA